MCLVEIGTADWFVLIWQVLLAPALADYAAFRSFVGYKVRLVNVLLSRAKGFEIDEAATVISFNPYFVSADFDDLLALFVQLAALGIVNGRLTEEAARQIHELRLQFDKNEAYFRRRFR